MPQLGGWPPGEKGLEEPHLTPSSKLLGCGCRPAHLQVLLSKKEREFLTAGD